MTRGRVGISASGTSHIARSPDWEAAPAERPLAQRLRDVPDELWRQRGLFILVPAVLTAAYMTLLADLNLTQWAALDSYARISVFYCCISIAAAVAGAFVPDEYRLRPSRSPSRLILMHTAVTGLGVIVGAEVGMLLFYLVGVTDTPGGFRSLVYGVGFVFVFLWQGALFFIESFELRAQQGEVREAMAKRDAVQARLDSLQARTHPHFLFNSLNVIASLIPVDARRAEEAIEALSDLLRYSLDVGSERTVPLRNELQAVHHFLALEKLRYGDRLRSRIEVEDGLEDTPVPPHSLQPLVENAVLHGVTQHEDGGEVGIECRRVGGFLLLRVEDDGPGHGRSAHSGTGTALRDLRTRVELLFGDTADLSVEDRRGGGCRVELRIPLAPDSSTSSARDSVG